MEQIPVKHKEPVAGFAGIPLWGLAALALVGLLGLIFGLRQCGARRAADTTTVVLPSGQCRADSECADRQLCLNATCTQIQAGLADCSLAQVHFATDSAELQPEDLTSIFRMARCLKADQLMKLTIAGNADERGSAEHNAELAEKRAMTVARALQAQGVSGKQLSVVNYGEHLPLCVDSDADCWAKNRRTALVPQAAPEAK